MRGARRVFARGALLLLACVASVLGAADDDAETLIGIDFGSEWIEVAVAQGTSIDIVLNENTQRKSLAALAFPDSSSKSNNDLRTFGEAAMARPHLALQYIRELLGECQLLFLFGPFSSFGFLFLKALRSFPGQSPPEPRLDASYVLTL